MATLVTRHIKADGSKDYTTVQAWNDAMPSNLVTADEQWDGYLWGEIVETGFNAKNCVFSGHAADATRYWRLLANTGEGPFASASVALKYNASNGAALKNTGGGSSNVSLYIPTGNSYFQVVGIQIYDESSAGILVDSCVGFLIDKVLVQMAVGTAGYALSLYHFTSGAAAYVQRFVFVQDHAGTPDGCIAFQGSSQQNVTIRSGFVIRPSNRTAGGVAIYCRGTNMAVRNVGFFGYTTIFGGTTTGFTCDYNATEDTSIEVDGGHSLTSSSGVVFANEITEPSTASAPDFRIKSGSVLDAAGVADLSTDAYGTTYDSPPSIGPHELVAGGGGGGGNAWHYRAQEAAAA